MGDTSVTERNVSIYNATPTVKVDNQSQSTVDQMLLAMEMTEREGGLTSMELRFSNYGRLSGDTAGYVFEDNAVLKLGAAIEVMAGDQTSPTSLFKGKVSALEGRYSAQNPPELVVLAEDALQAARLKRRSKTYENFTLAQLVSNLAQSCGLTPRIDGLSDNIGDYMQMNESDLAFVRRVLARYDADLQVVGDELHAAPRAQIQRNRIELSLAQKLRGARVVADLAHQVTKIELSSWDYSQGQVAYSSRDANPPGPGTGTAGSEILQRSFGARAEQLASIQVRDTSEAQAIVDAEWEQRSRSFVIVHGTAEGNPDLRVGSHVVVSDLGARFSNTYAVVATTHRYDQTHGYETDFTAECAFLAGASS